MAVSIPFPPSPLVSPRAAVTACENQPTATKLDRYEPTMGDCFYLLRQKICGQQVISHNIYLKNGLPQRQVPVCQLGDLHRDPWILDCDDLAIALSRLAGGNPWGELGLLLSACGLSIYFGTLPSWQQYDDATKSLTILQGLKYKVQTYAQKVQPESDDSAILLWLEKIIQQEGQDLFNKKILVFLSGVGSFSMGFGALFSSRLLCRVILHCCLMNRLFMAIAVVSLVLYGIGKMLSGCYEVYRYLTGMHLNQSIVNLIYGAESDCLNKSHEDFKLKYLFHGLFLTFSGFLMAVGVPCSVYYGIPGLILLLLAIGMSLYTEYLEFRDLNCDKISFLSKQFFQDNCLDVKNIQKDIKDQANWLTSLQGLQEAYDESHNAACQALRDRLNTNNEKDPLKKWEIYEKFLLDHQLDGCLKNRLLQENNGIAEDLLFHCLICNEKPLTSKIANHFKADDSVVFDFQKINQWPDLKSKPDSIAFLEDLILQIVLKNLLPFYQKKDRTLRTILQVGPSSLHG